jgi:ABC-2 type transport system permease protein
MQVFRAYFKVMRGSAVSLTISLSVFVGLAVLFSFIAPKTSIADFEPTRTPVAVINRDGDAELAQGLVDYLARTSRLVQYPDDEEKLQDALFYRKVEYIAIIPSGFSDAFMSGGDCTIGKVIVPDSTSSYYVDMSIDKFLNTVRLHRLYGGEEFQAQLVAAAMADLAIDTPVAMRSFGRTHGSHEPYSYYYAYCAYALLAMIMTGVSSIMIAFNEPDLYMRNLCAPLPKRSMSLQLAAGHGVFALGCWGILVFGSIILHGKSLLPSGLVGLYSLNTLAFAVVCAGIGFLVGSSVKSYGAQAGAINVIAMGMSFLGGVFVPQSIMSKQVLAVAKFLPSYWFIRANDAISELSRFTGDSLRPIYGCILIQLGFAVAVFSVTLFLSKERRVSYL